MPKLILRLATLEKVSPFLRFKGRVAAVIPVVGSLFGSVPVCRRVAPVFATFPTPFLQIVYYRSALTFDFKVRGRRIWEDFMRISTFSGSKLSFFHFPII